jgi:hypothetical protein
MQQITEQQARALAFLLNEMRPDWPIESLMTHLGRNREVPSLGALVLAATTKALDPTCKTPEPIFRQGTHWPAEARDQLPRGPRCAKHRDFYVPCPSCAGDRKAERTDDPYQDLPPDPRWVKETTA